MLCSCYFASAGGRAGSANTRVLAHVMGERSWIETPDSDRSEGLSVRSRAGTRLLHANSRCSPYETIFIHNLCALLLLLLTLLLVRVQSPRLTAATGSSPPSESGQEEDSTR